MAKPKKSGRPKYRKKPAVSNPPASFVEGAANSDAVVQVKKPHAGQLAEQARARYALEALTDAIANSKDESDFRHSELKAYVRRLPSMIQINGFGQAMAFYYAKSLPGGQKGSDINSKSIDGVNAYGVVYNVVETWLCQNNQIYGDTSEGKHRLLTAITTNDQQLYRAAQAETHALMRWVKKFAEALIVKNDELQ